MDELEYQKTVEQIQGYSDSFKANSDSLELELIRNAGIHAMLFMLSAEYVGYDTCPMHVHNVEQLRNEFNIPDHLIPVMMITIGKSVDRVRPRGYR